MMYASKQLCEYVRMIEIDVDVTGRKIERGGGGEDGNEDCKI